jgi:hypothetical protein
MRTAAIADCPYDNNREFSGRGWRDGGGPPKAAGVKLPYEIAAI